MGRKSKYKDKSSGLLRDKRWQAGLYIRLSRDDGDEDESNSVSSQRLILQEYSEKLPELSVVDYFVDDGFTGTNFNRPEFKRLMDEIRDGHINCVIVKDLSRFGRNYIEVGNYLEKIFPFMGIRFISILDSLDSFLKPRQMNTLIVPVQNMINDAYCQDVSSKVRQSLDNKRRSGKFIGAFCAYGFIKDKGHKGNLLVDRIVEPVIQDIYKWFLDGVPVLAIARRLNDRGILTPLEYKKHSGSNYQNPNCVLEGASVWGYSSVKRILTNRMYCGDLVQGIKRIASYKVKKALTVPEDEWIICENHHDAIVSRDDFNRVQKIFDANKRRGAKTGEVSLFAGFMRCSDCGMAMSYCNKFGYKYYICSKYAKATKHLCTRRSVRMENIEVAVLEAIRAQVSMAVEMDILLQELEKEADVRRQSDKLQALMYEKENQIRELIRKKEDLYVDWKDKLLSRNEYFRMKQQYTEEICCVENEIRTLKIKKEGQSGFQRMRCNDFMMSFMKYRNIEYLTREVLLELVDTIYVHNDERITIKFRFRDELAMCRKVLEQNELLS